MTYLNAMAHYKIPVLAEKLTYFKNLRKSKKATNLNLGGIHKQRKQDFADFCSLWMPPYSNENRLLTFLPN